MILPKKTLTYYTYECPKCKFESDEIKHTPNKTMDVRCAMCHHIYKVDLGTNHQLTQLQKDSKELYEKVQNSLTKLGYTKNYNHLINESVSVSQNIKAIICHASKTN